MSAGMCSSGVQLRVMLICGDSISRTRHGAYFGEKRARGINDVWISNYIYHYILSFTKRENESSKCVFCATTTNLHIFVTATANAFTVCVYVRVAGMTWLGGTVLARNGNNFIKMWAP